MLHLLGLNAKNAKNWIMAFATIFAIAGVPYLEIELHECIKGFFENPLVRKVVLFSAIYLNTQDLYISGFITIVYTIIVEILLSNSLTKEEMEKASKKN